MGLLTGKTALVTGAARGIGKAVAMKFASEGANIAFTDLVLNDDMAAGLEATRKEIEALGVTCRAYAGNAADFEETEKVVKQIHADFGSIDVLVNNAGIAQQKLFTELSASDWQRMMQVHIDGAFHCCRAVVPSMVREKRGKIINISSIWGLAGASCEVHYSTAKAALIGFTKALAKELAPSNIQVNCVAPGVINTDMCKDFDAETLAALCEETPLGRLGTPADVAGTVCFLASRAADFITGQVLSPNGGIVI